MKSEQINEQPVVTLAELIDRLPSVESSASCARRRRSALNTFSLVVGRPLESIEAEPTLIAKLLSTADPSAVGIGSSRWDNVKTDVRGLLRTFRLVKPLPVSIKLAPEWEELVGLVRHQAERSTFRRFAVFCHLRGLTPGQITAGTFEEYLAELSEAALSIVPQRIMGDARRTWNRAVKMQGGQLPIIEPPIDLKHYSFSWDELEPGLKADVDAFLAPRSIDTWDSEEDLPELSAATRYQYSRMFRRLASAAIHNGAPREAIKSIGDLVLPSTLKGALKFLQQRNGGEPTKDMFHMATLAKSAAKNWARLPREDLAKLERWWKNLRYGNTGLTEKNRDRLRQFVDAAAHGRLLIVGSGVFGRMAARPFVSMRMAATAAQAVMVAIETVAPIRLKNLAALDFARHIRPAFSTKEKTWVLTLSASETKNKVDLSLPLPGWLMEMIESYRARYHPILTRGQPSTWMFPGRRPGAPMSESGVAKAITAFMRRELGLQMNTHLFRHLAALIFLKENPGNYEMVRRLLGHKNIQTTTSFYVGLESEQAFERFHEILRARRVERQ